MRRILLYAAVGILPVVGIGLAWAVRHPEIEPLAEAPDLDPEAVALGETLAGLGGCASCHGEDLAGGAPLHTPFGTIHVTNITPDLATGIGSWPPKAFRRAMRNGVDREGRYLYPAFPFDAFTNATDADLDALYAFLRSVPAVAKDPLPNELAFPFNIRLLMAGWTTLFHEPGPFEPDPAQDAVWNRGAYLAEGLGHCQACHTPRNAFGARDRNAVYAGAMVEGWWSPALDGSGTSPLGWTSDELVNYFYDGWDENHGIAAGPMAEVVGNISMLPEEDVTALSIYFAAHSGASADTEARAAARDAAAQTALAAGINPDPTGDPAIDNGATLFVARCVNCHRSGSETVPLALATAVTGPRPENFIRIVLDGVIPTANAYFVRPMPGFRQLNASEISDLSEYVRHQFADAAPWADVARVLETELAQPQ
jgi:mono/diheme cytochrome c family protein